MGENPPNRICAEDAIKCSRITKNPFFNFLRCFRTWPEHQHFTASQLAILGAKHWKRLTDSEKEPYRQMAAPYRKKSKNSSQVRSRSRSRSRSEKRGGSRPRRGRPAKSQSASSYRKGKPVGFRRAGSTSRTRSSRSKSRKMSRKSCKSSTGSCARRVVRKARPSRSTRRCLTSRRKRTTSRANSKKRPIRKRNTRSHRNAPRQKQLARVVRNNNSCCKVVGASSTADVIMQSPDGSCIRNTAYSRRHSSDSTASCGVCNTMPKNNVSTLDATTTTTPYSVDSLSGNSCCSK